MYRFVKHAKAELFRKLALLPLPQIKPDPFVPEEHALDFAVCIFPDMTGQELYTCACLAHRFVNTIPEYYNSYPSPVQRRQNRSGKFRLVRVEEKKV